MALPNKKSLRKITVEDNRYYWRLDRYDGENLDQYVLIGKADDPNKTFNLVFKSIDWIYWGSRDHDFKDVEIEIKIVTPQHIANAIKEAIKAGWEDMPYKEELIIRQGKGRYKAQ